MSVIEDKLLKENEALKAELEKARKAAEENANYKAFIENRVNQKAKDSVFINLFYTRKTSFCFIVNSSQKIRLSLRLTLSCSR